MSSWKAPRRLAGLVLAFGFFAVAEAAPAPGGHDEMLRQLIQDTVEGRIRYQTLAPDLAQAVRPQAALARSELTALGSLKSVTFVSTNRAGSEIYRTVFEKGVLEWAFAVDAQGLITNAIYRPATPGPS